MTEEDLESFTALMENAKTDEERGRIKEQWLPHLSRCLLSTNKHVKAVEEAVEEVSDRIEKLSQKMDRLHNQPSFKEDRIGWLRTNWMWCIIMLYVLQQLLGINAAGLIQNWLGK